MNKSVFILVAFAFATLTLTNCKKDDQKSFKDSLAGHWKSVEVKVADANLTNSSSFDLTLEASREFDLDFTTSLSGSSNTTSSNGDWLEDDTKQDVTLTFNGSGDTVTYDVKSIDDTQMQVEYIQNGIRYQVKFKKI